MKKVYFKTKMAKIAIITYPFILYFQWQGKMR